MPAWNKCSSLAVCQGSLKKRSPPHERKKKKRRKGDERWCCVPCKLEDDDTMVHRLSYRRWVRITTRMPHFFYLAGWAPRCCFHGTCPWYPLPLFEIAGRRPTGYVSTDMTFEGAHLMIHAGNVLLSEICFPGIVSSMLRSGQPPPAATATATAPAPVLHCTCTPSPRAHDSDSPSTTVRRCQPVIPSRVNTGAS